MTPVHFTPTQRRILSLLRDGQPHRWHEVLTCLDDRLASRSNIREHLRTLRKVIRPHGYDILCVYHRRGVSYRIARTVSTLTL